MQPEDQLNPDEQVKAENEILKLKLELEYGMNQSDTSALNAETENQWLNYIYNFEQQSKDKEVQLPGFG